MPSEQIINVMVTIREPLCTVTLRCFKSRHLVTVLTVPMFHISHLFFFLPSFHVTSDISLLPVAVYCSFVTGLTVMIRPEGWTLNMISSTALASAVCMRTSPYLSDTPLLCNKLKSQTDPRWDTLAGENTVVTCHWENYDHWVMRWNRLIS